MKEKLLAAQERLHLVASNSMRIAGIQGVYGDPCGLQIVPLTLEDALLRDVDEVLLVDADSVMPLFEMLSRLRGRRPLARVIVIGIDHDETYVECVIAAGAKGFLGANASADEFRYAIYNVREGSIWATRRVLSRLAERQLLQRLPDKIDPSVRFTEKECQIIRLLLDGKCNREIGLSMGIGPFTVKAHLGRIMRKAGVGNRIELTMFAVKHQSIALAG
ncbi:DNA-binding NarL/FixJ family response regulator [Granulicella aggregans]|jgi:DNA-binding NarL/FixJ family response regulator|uniref:DNA-binding NarL/FixJ family response regulator n=1 Tax=Granulicella aggregans TaxID=474949 RepID=A0A7W8E343_9BACT|nr:response regulator transcription factor [Granulicella aggregans]MBB5057588.1 DNA-binding NarL/FixJ family response regulator [Granulicella aggregans]